MSAWLWAAARTDVVVWVEAEADEVVASLVAELLHAPIAATAASTATPLATVFVFFTTLPFSGSALSGSTRQPHGVE
jgi:hypothetical protein